MTAPASIHPRPVDELLPAARELRDRLQALPSRNQLMRELRIGAPKATELRDALIAEYAAELTGSDDEPDADLPGLDGDLAEPVPDPWAYAEPIGPDPWPATPAPEPAPAIVVAPEPVAPAAVAEASEQVTVDGHPGTPSETRRAQRPAVWPVVLLALPAFVAVWSGWVGLGKLTGFGRVDLLPGIVDPGGWATIDSAITLPIGVETYAAYALYVWLSGRVPARAQKFAKWSAIGSLVVGSLGQVAYHLLVAAGETKAPWWITMLVACLPVAVLGMGAALGHMVREEH